MQDAQEQALAKAGSKDDNERLIGALIQAGVLSLDFGFTAYATNAYLKRSAVGLQGAVRFPLLGCHHRTAGSSGAVRPVCKHSIR